MKPIILPQSYKYIAIFLTMRCDLNCSFCLNAFEKSFNRKDFKEIAGEDWIKALNRIESRPDIPITFSGGEPSVHKDFIYILKNLNAKSGIDILTNLYWSEEKTNQFINEINPKKINRNSPYPSIRVSYHPEQMGDGDKIIKNAKKLQEAGFSIGIYSVQYPNPKTLEAITKMQFTCRNNNLDFRIKDFTGKFEGYDDFGRPFSITYGDYSKYPNSAFSKETKDCLCKTSELIIGPDANVYKCHRDLFAEEYAIGSLLNPDFELRDIFRKCNNYGKCHPCDVKIKTDYKQELGHTSVEIKEIRD